MATAWRKFKPPIVTEIEIENPDHEVYDGGLSNGEPETVKRLVVIDGQHTAIMAVSRGFTSIPWLRIKTAGVGSQAEAFIGQNKDRTAISAMHEYVAALAAGQEWALDVQNVLNRSGAKLIMWNKPTFEAGETLALGTIKTLINRRSVPSATKALRICTQAGLAPISADHLKAVEQLLFADEFKGVVKEDKLTFLLTGALGVKLAADAATFAATHRVPKWKGLTSVLWQNRGRV